jgi:ankyrin repeat protein
MGNMKMEKRISLKDIKVLEKYVNKYYEPDYVIVFGKKSILDSKRDKNLKVYFGNLKNNPTIEELKHFLSLLDYIGNISLFIETIFIFNKYKENFSPQYLVSKSIEISEYQFFIEKLIKRCGKNIINMKDSDGNNALSYTDNIRIADILVAYGIKNVPKIHFFYKKLEKFKILQNDITIKDCDKKFININYKGCNPLLYILPNNTYYSIYILNKDRKLSDYINYILKCAKILLESGVDINFQDKNGYTALHNIIDWEFIYFNLPKDDKDECVNSKIDFSFVRFKYELIKFLIKNNINLNLQDKNGNTPLHSVVSNYTNSIEHMYGDINILYDDSRDIRRMTNIVEEEKLNKKRFYFKDEKLNYWKCECDIGKDCIYTIIHYNNVEDFIEILLYYGADINIQNIDGYTPFHMMLKEFRETYFYSIENLKELIEIFVKNGANLSLKDIYGNTPIHYITYKIKDFDILKYIIELSLKKGANFNIKNNDGQRAVDFVRDFEIREMMLYPTYSQAKNLIKIINLFTKDNPIKYTTHSFEWNKYGSYQNFIDEVKGEFKKIEDELKLLSPNLYTKIDKFLFNSNFQESGGWGVNKIAFGWSSPELKEWCEIEERKSNPKKAIYFPLPEKYQYEIDGKRLTTFGDICNIFKDEIEIRDNDKLSSILSEIEEDILGFDFDVEYINLENVSFYTDVEYFKNGIKKIFEQFGDRKEFDTIEIEADRYSEYVEIMLTQIESKVSKTSLIMESEIRDGDFYDIQRYFKSLCDWSIEAKFQDGNFRIEYLSSKNICAKREKIEKEPKGFKHILRFYK